MYCYFCDAPYMADYICEHCHQKVLICSRHKVYQAHAHEGMGGTTVLACPTCIGWDKVKQTYTKACRCGFRCGKSEEPMDEQTFTKQQDEVIKEFNDNRSKQGKRKLERSDKPGGYWETDKNITVDQKDYDAIISTKKKAKASGPQGTFKAINDENSKNLLNIPTPKKLRVMSWNIMDLGGGFQGKRSDEIINAIAKIIDSLDPHVCAIIEVLKKKAGTQSKKKRDPYASSYYGSKKKRKKKKGATTTPVASTATTTSQHPGVDEVKKIVLQLNAVSKNKWKVAFHPTLEYTGNGSESYAFIYKDCPEISVDDKTIMYTTKDTGGNALGFPDINKRAPMQAVFTFKGNLGSKKGDKSNQNAWKLPIIAFHAPAQHDNTHNKGKGHDPEPVKALENLAKISIVDPTDKDPNKHKGNAFPEYVIGADLNINFDFYSGITFNSEDKNIWIQDAEYIQKAYQVLEGIGYDRLVGQEIFPARTSLKQVTTHFFLEEYGELGAENEDLIEQWEEEDFIVEEDLEKLFNLSKEVDKGTKKQQDLDNFADSLIAKYYELPTNKQDAEELKDEVREELNRHLEYLEYLELRQGEEGLPSTMFSYCENSFDKLMLIQKYDQPTDDKPNNACVLEDAQVWVLPFQSLVIPKTVLGKMFFGRVLEKEYGDKVDRDAMLCAELTKTYDAIYQKYFNSGPVDLNKMPLNGFLEVAHKISDHLPLIMDLTFS